MPLAVALWHVKIMMILWGYGAVLSYVALLLCLTEVVFSRIMSHEVCRKTLHIGTFFTLPIARYFFRDEYIHLTVISVLFVAITLVMHRKRSRFTVDLREKHYPGIVYYAISFVTVTLAIQVFSLGWIYLYPPMLALCFGDGFATLIGHHVSSYRIYRKKTLIGFLSCIGFTSFSMVLVQLLTEWYFSWYHILLLSLLAAIAELVDFGLDNLFIPFSVLAASVLMMKVEGVTAALLVFESVFLIAFFSRLITYAGSLLAGLIGAMFYYWHTLTGFLFVIFCYAVMVTVSLISKRLKRDVSDVVKKTRGKDITEVFVNGFGAMLATLLYAITEHEEFHAIALLTLAAGFVDSLASDIGTLSRATPFDPFKGKRVARGMSGGMTLLGSLASLVGAIVFSVCIVWILELSFLRFTVIAALLYFGSLFDTFLGSWLQVKYNCPICHKKTERQEHCGTETVKIAGVSWINNDTVNLLSNTAVFLLSLLLFL